MPSSHPPLRCTFWAYFLLTLSFVSHVNTVTHACYFQICKIGKIWQYISTPAAIYIVQALVLSRLDCCNSIFLGLPDHQLNRLQSVKNTAARLIFSVRWKDHVTPILWDRLHWQKILEHIVYKSCSLTFRALNDPSVRNTHLHLYTAADVRPSEAVVIWQANLPLRPLPSRTVMLGERSMTPLQFSSGMRFPFQWPRLHPLRCSRLP